MDSSQSPAAGGNGTLISQTNDTAASAGADDPMQKLNQVSNSIQKTLGLIHQLYLTVSTFNAAFQMPLLQRMYFSSIPSLQYNYSCITFRQCPNLIIFFLLKFSSNGLVAELDNMVKLAEKCNIQVPMEVVK
jgi:mediator of RNA polymerase II transcription subunit 10